MSEPYLYQIHIPDKEFPILFHIARSGRPGEMQVDRHWHREMEILYMLEGSMEVHLSGRDFQADAGDLILVGSNEIHAIRNLKTPSLHACITIDLRFLEGSFYDACDQKYIGAFLRSSFSFGNGAIRDAKLTEIFQKIAREIQERERGYELYVKAGLYEFFGVLVREKLEAGLTQGEFERRLRNAERLRPVLDKMEEEHAASWTVQALSEELGLGQSRFGHIFKDTTGMRPLEYLRRIRIRKAALLLDEGQATVTEIAEACGFENVNYFCRAFRQEMGQSAGKYRNRERG